MALFISKASFRAETDYKKIIRYIPYNLANIKGSKYWIRKFEKSMRKHPVFNQKYVGDIYGFSFENHLDEPAALEFEKYMLSAPANYDECLKNIYGNYMELPPEEKRVSHHNFSAHYKEDR